jgi:2-oxoglutarate ferredoxin oxidoreductase subunit alpha
MAEGYALAARVDGDRLIMMGNDAIAYGALVGGCRFMAGYPITPATDVLEWMAKYLPKYGGVTSCKPKTSSPRST